MRHCRGRTRISRESTLLRRNPLARSLCARPTPDRSLAQSLSIPRRRMDGRAGSLSMARQEPLCGVSGAPISRAPPCNTHARPDPASTRPVRRSSGRSRSRDLRECGAAATPLPPTVARWQQPRASCDMAGPTAPATGRPGAPSPGGTHPLGRPGTVPGGKPRAVPVPWRVATFDWPRCQAISRLEPAADRAEPGGACHADEINVDAYCAR
jgi:hypothetical protein